MHFFARFARGQFSLTRTEAFSDAVFAYAAFAVYALTPLFYITPWNERDVGKSTTMAREK